MRDTFRKLGRLVGAVCLIGLALSAAPARAQTIPQWLKDTTFVQNRHLWLWEKFQSSTPTKFDVWSNEQRDIDAFFKLFFFGPGGSQSLPILGTPWGPRMLSAPHPPFNQANPDTNPYCNMVTLRFVDPTMPTGITDVAYPTGGAAVFGPPTPDLPLEQGFFAPYRFQSGTVQVTQKVQFARDLVRIEIIVQNLPVTGATARRVGVRLLVDSFMDYLGNTRSVFIPSRQQQILFEDDFGRRTGTNTIPTYPAIPPVWQHFSDDQIPNPSFMTKGYLTETGQDPEVEYGATPPTRFGIVNTLNLFPNEGVWDYPTDFHQELRISDAGFVLWWDPIDVPVGKSVSFVTYAGLGRADHGMSRLYLNGQRDSLNSNDPSIQGRTQGFIGAVETPFAIGLANGNADLNANGQPNLVNLTAFMQNMYHDPSVPSIPNASAFVELPDGLALAPTSQQNPIQYGNIPRLSTGQDEAQGALSLQATGIEAGLLPVRITYNDGFGDSATAVRRVNVPQGRLYQLGDDYRFVTFPFTYNANQDDPADVLGLQAGSFQIKQWNPLTLDYEDVDRVQPGHGYWVRLLGQGNTFTRLSSNSQPIKPGQTTSTLVTLHDGWNQVGNPSPYTVPLRELQFLIPGNDFVKYAQAKTRNLIRFGVYLYNVKTGQYGSALTEDALVPPGQAMWIFSNGEQTMLWPTPVGPQLSITP